MTSILLIDDDDDYRGIVGEVLEGVGFRIYEAACPDEAFPVLLTTEVDLVICDLHMPFTRGPQRGEFLESVEVGIKTLRELREAVPHTGIVALTAFSPRDIRRIQGFIDPVPVYSKPRCPSDLIRLVVELLIPRQEQGGLTLDC